MNDSGEHIAKILGYTKIIMRNANDYKNKKNLVEAQFLCSGEMGTGIVFSAFDDIFPGKVVFFGERGDKIYSKNWPSVNNDFFFDHEIYAGTSLIESRLRAGYIIFPLPLYGADNWESIFKISNSDEMLKFSIGGDYDRPIPRRILEEAGVPRHLFGQKKIGAGFNYRFDNKKRLQARMSSYSYKSFRLNYNSKNNLTRLASYIDFLLSNRVYYFNYLLSKLRIKYKVPINGINLKGNPYTPLDLFNWSINIMKGYYK